MRRTSKRIVPIALAALLALVVAGIGSATRGAPATPITTGPSDGSTFEALPTFAWQPVSGAERYEFEIAADAGFNSPPLGTGTTGDAIFFTKNTRAALKKTVPNGEYWWHVRAVDEDGAVSQWSPARSFFKSWSTQPAPLSPADSATLVYPSDPLKLTWSPVPRAENYLVWVSSDPALGSLLWGGPTETQATSFTGSDTGALAPGRYYWAVTPLDSAGNHGARSRVASFVWSWPTTTTPRFTDLHSAPEVVDPHFSWDAVPGAAGYEVEVNASQDWAAGSKVCCPPLRVGGDVTTLATSLSPPQHLNNNTYYWRVRAIDTDGNAGVWNVGPSFTQTFANVPPTPAPSVKNLRLRDNLSDPHDGADPAGVGYPLTTGAPVLSWNPVPGASSYEVDVTPYVLNACDWSSDRVDHWVKVTSTTAWTALGGGWNAIKPFPSPTAVSTDGNRVFAAGQQYCARVRPIDRASTTSGPSIFGDWTYLPQNNTPAFQFTSYPAEVTCSPCPMPASNYRLPLVGSVTGRMPLFTWQAITGADAYFVLVARDAAFTNVVDYAFTQVPAYAPRQLSLTKGYPDETTLYYWAVLPADLFDGGGVSSDPRDGSPPNFHKQSAPPTIQAPATGEISTGPTLFRWTPAEGARRYWLEVAQDPSFVNPIDQIPTDSTSYTSNTTYPADTVLYWRVRAEAENGSQYVGLTWSATGTFQKRLATPSTNPEPSAGNLVPTWAWAPVPGAIAYDFRIVRPDGNVQDFAGLRSAAFTPSALAGTGIWQWQVRAQFPTPTLTPITGPYSALRPFTRTMPEPANATSDTGPRHISLHWDPRAEADGYRVQLSQRADFGTILNTVKTENTDFAPDIMSPAYRAGGTFYWRVATVDWRGNLGDFTSARPFDLLASGTGSTARRIFLRATGRLRLNRRSRVVIYARDATGAPVAGARVRLVASGLKTQTKATGRAGRAIFTVRPSRRGRVAVRATKAGFLSASLLVRVR